MIIVAKIVEIVTIMISRKIWRSLLTDKTRAENALLSIEQSLPLNPPLHLQTASQLESDSLQESTVLSARSTFWHNPCPLQSAGHDFSRSSQIDLKQNFEMHWISLTQVLPSLSTSFGFEQIVLASPAVPIYPSKHGPHVLAVCEHGWRFKDEHSIATKQFTALNELSAAPRMAPSFSASLLSSAASIAEDAAAATYCCIL